MQTAAINKKTTAPVTELETILARASQISRDSQLNEVCSEALLCAILDNEAIAARLLNKGLNIFKFKKQLLDRLKAKAIESAPAEPLYSVAVQGLLVLNAMDKDVSNVCLNLLKTIIKNQNTAAARLLKTEGIYLNNFNEVVYKPVTE